MDVGAACGAADGTAAEFEEGTVVAEVDIGLYVGCTVGAAVGEAIGTSVG